jgi:putative transposase
MRFLFNDQRVVAVLDRLKASGLPQTIKIDYGPEMVSVTLADWAEQHHVLLEFIKPGRPMPERIHRKIQSQLP